MTLLKNDLPAKTTPIAIKRWPTERWPEGVGISVRDGWNFGIGFGAAMIIVVPLIALAASCAGWILFISLGEVIRSVLG